MRFLCVACDEAMALHGTRGPDEGSMTVLFRCPSCGCEIAMLTNAMETQMVRSLGVRIGGRTAPAAPMEMVRSSLMHPRAEETVPAAPAPTPEQAPEKAPTEAAGGSRCPFTGAVTEAFRTQAGPHWTEPAQARLDRIPPYARPMVRQSIEQFAREQGHTEITEGLIDQVRGRMGM